LTIELENLAKGDTVTVYAADPDGNDMAVGEISRDDADGYRYLAFGDCADTIGITGRADLSNSIVINAAGTKQIISMNGGNAGDTISFIGGSRLTLNGGSGDDLVSVDENTLGKNLLRGGAGNDTFDIKTPGNTIYGDEGEDRIILDGGNNIVYAGGENDTIIAVGLGNTVMGDEGDDTVIVKTVKGNQNLISGNGGKDRLEVNGGNKNTIKGGADDDAIIFTAANDDTKNIICGDEGNDKISISGGKHYTVSGDNGDDSVACDNVAYAKINGNNGDDSIAASGSRNTLCGDDGADTLIADGDKNKINGGAGDDVIKVAGAASVTLGSGADCLRLAENAAVTVTDLCNDDSLILSFAPTLAAYDEADGIVNFSGENAQIKFTALNSDYESIKDIRINNGKTLAVLMGRENPPPDESDNSDETDEPKDADKSGDDREGDKEGDNKSGAQPPPTDEDKPLAPPDNAAADDDSPIDSAPVPVDNTASESREPRPKTSGTVEEKMNPPSPENQRDNLVEISADFSRLRQNIIVELSKTGLFADAIELDGVHSVKGADGHANILIGTTTHNDTLVGGSGGRNSLWGGGEYDDVLVGSDDAADFFHYGLGEGNDSLINFAPEGAEKTDRLVLFSGYASSTWRQERNIILSWSDERALTLIRAEVGDENDVFVYGAYSTGELRRAKIGFSDRLNEFLYASEITEYFGNTAENGDCLRVGANIAAAGIYLDGSAGVIYRGITVIDAANSPGRLELAGGITADSIKGGKGINSLWGGASQNSDTLIGGAGQNVFYYGQYEGRDVIKDSAATDKVVLYNLTYDRPCAAFRSDKDFVAVFDDGSTLTVENIKDGFTAVFTDRIMVYNSGTFY